MIKPPGPGDVRGVPPTPASATTGAAVGRGDAARLVVAVSAAADRRLFTVGETVTAQLVERLPNRQWVAIVKGAALTLRLPATDAARAAAGSAAGTVPSAGASGAAEPAPLGVRGDVLTLRVATLAPRLGFVLTPAAGPPASAGGPLQLSDAARYLGTLLRASEAAAPQTASTPLQPQLPLAGADPSAAAALRAQSLAQAVRNSGLFYESHLRAWSEGRMTLEQLHAEPQARAGASLKEGTAEQRGTATADLGRLAQRQLDVLDGRAIMLAGTAWAGQPVDWSIGRDGDEPGGSADADAQAWSTRLALTLPRLGALAAQLRVVGKQVQLRFSADDAATAARLSGGRDALAERLQRAGLQLQSWTVEHGRSAAAAAQDTPSPDRRDRA